MGKWLEGAINKGYLLNGLWSSHKPIQIELYCDSQTHTTAIA